MGQFTTSQIKQIMGSLITAEQQAAAVGGLDLDRETLEFEFLVLGLYVAGADNDISQAEIDLVKELFDKDLNDMDTMMRAISILKENQESWMVNLELPGFLLSKAMSQLMDDDMTGLYINVVELVLTAFAEIDGNADPQEMAFITNFINRLNNNKY